MAKLRAAVVQDGTSRQGTSTTLEKTEALIAQCVSRGANVAVFPEAFIGGYPKGADFHIYLGARTAAGRDDFLAYYNESIVVPGPETERLGIARRRASRSRRFGNWRTKIKAEPQPLERKLLYRRRGLSRTLSQPP